MLYTTRNWQMMWYAYVLKLTCQIPAILVIFPSPNTRTEYIPSYCSSTMTSLPLYHDVTAPLPWRHCPSTMTSLLLYHDVTVPLPWRHCPSTMTSLSLYHDVTAPLPWRHCPLYDVTILHADGLWGGFDVSWLCCWILLIIVTSPSIMTSLTFLLGRYYLILLWRH